MVFNVQLAQKLILYSFVWGALSGALYDIFAAVRILLKNGRTVTFVSDLLFCLLFSACMCVLFYNCTNGRIRLYAFAFAACGFALYRVTLGKLNRFVFERVCAFVQKLFLAGRKAVYARMRAAKRALYSRMAYRRGLKNAKKGFGAHGT